MDSDLLAQLRDIHEPLAPGWWPPAPGWWLLALLCMVVALILIRAWRQRRRRWRPLRAARTLHEQLVKARTAGTLDAHGYAHAANELLKRVFVHALALDHVAPLSGQAWLRFLDDALGEPQFTRGRGQALGAARFDPGAEIDASALSALVSRLLRELTPRHARRLGPRPGSTP
ncbi:MAG TPA: DUF4381 domain-containing protein [Gammaproteobacteria bacterium]|nr:DUF4381 domain-containing protein [Gammaproteobacteria bacterium]